MKTRKMDAKTEALLLENWLKKLSKTREGREFLEEELGLEVVRPYAGARLKKKKEKTG